MLRSWVIYILALLGAITFFLFYKMWLSWFILIIVLSIVPIALVVSFAASLFFQLEADAFRKVIKGDSTQISFTSYGLEMFPFALYSVKAPLKEMMTGAVSYIKLFSQSETTDSVIIDTKHCGTYRLTTAKVRIYDLFGLIFIPKTVDVSGAIVVMPIPQIPAEISDMDGFKAKGLKKSSNPNSEIYDIRTYMPGDPIKQIHWKISAKKDALMIKESQEATWGRSRVYLPMTRDREVMDRMLGEVMFTSKYFLDHEIEHKIRVLPPMKKEVAFDVSSKDELEKAIVSILRLPIPEDVDDEK